MQFIAECVRDQGARVLTMDVSVLGDPSQPTDISKHEVAAAGGMTIDEVIALGDENKAFRVMSRGAALVVAKAHAEGRFDGMLATGGTMGTDLALDCAQALPMGVPKYIVSHRQLFPPDPTAPSSARYSDDPLGWGFVWHEFDLPLVAVTGRRCRGGRNQSRDSARTGATVDRYDLAGIVVLEVYEDTQTRAGTARV